MAVPVQDTEKHYYKITGKHIYRASTSDLQMGTREDGSPNIVRQNGPVERLEVDSVLDDVTLAELSAFGDRLQLIDEEEATLLRNRMANPTLRALAGVHEPASGPGDPVQKPPLTGEQAVVAQQMRAQMQTEEAKANAEHARIDQEKAEAQAKIMVEPGEPPAQARARGARAVEDKDEPRSTSRSTTTSHTTSQTTGTPSRS